MFRRIILIALAPLAIVMGAAVPAFASSGPSQTVNVSVNSAISISGLSDVVFNPIATGGGTVGCPVAFAAPAVMNGTCQPETFGIAPNTTTINAPAQEYTVTSNDGLGYTLTEAAGLAAFEGPGSSTNPAIPDAQWVIQTYSGFNPATGTQLFSGNPTTTATTVVHTTSGPSSDLYSELWVLNVPSTLAAGTYQNTDTYLATGN